MSFTAIELENFGSRLVSLGGRLNYDKICQKPIDIEKFFLDSTLFIFADERLGRCIEHWIRRYGQIVDPTKIINLIENEKYKYDPAVLGVYLKIIKKQQLLILKKYVIKNKEVKHRSPSKVRVREKDFDPTWFSYNIATHKYFEENNKSLLNHDFVLTNVKEISDRFKE